MGTRSGSFDSLSWRKKHSSFVVTGCQTAHADRPNRGVSLDLAGGTRLARETRMDVALFLVSRSSGLFLGVGLMWMLRASLCGLMTSQGDFTSTPSGPPDSP